MADTSYAKKSATFTFEGGLTRKVTFGNFDPTKTDVQAVAAFKEKIAAFNDSDVSKVSAYYFSNPDDNGNIHPVTGISAADITTTEKTVIYAKTESARLAALNSGDSNGEGE